MLRLQNLILEMVAKGDGLRETTDRLCREVETMLPGIICSVLLVDQAGSLHPLAGPSLPPSYSAAIEGLSIGPEAGSCGTAAYLRKPVTVTDIETDPRWARFSHLALYAGFKACWSSPICDADGRVLGTFAFYYNEKRGPSPAEEAVVATCVHLCAIAMERHERARELDRLARIDGLTGLSNRACFNMTLANLDCTEPGAWGLLVLDIDNLKVTNDTFGHHAGDVLLKEVASRVAAACAPDTAFRLGGDEFAVIVHSPGALRDIDKTADAILDALVAPVQCDGHIIYPNATVGGAILTAGDRTAERVRQNADFALYHAKETGRGGFVRYWPGIGTAIIHRLSAIRDVGTALREDRIDAYYQPIVRFDTREVVGLEALCRMTTENGDILPAGAFSTATSDAHVASALTDLMLARVAGDLRRWIGLGIPLQYVSVNISSADFHRGGLDQQIVAAFRQEDVPLDRLVVEVTEDVYLGKRDYLAARRIRDMRTRGLRIALDDFGTGFASLTHLLTVPVDIIKIDKSFVDRLGTGHSSSAIVEGLLLIARKLGISVVAEGIETEEQATQLSSFGCTLGQGFLFSRAVDRAATTALLTGAPSLPDDIAPRAPHQRLRSA